MNALQPSLGAGAWEIDLTHFPRPPSPICRSLYTTVFPAGLAEGMAQMGLLLETLQLKVAPGGYIYTQPKLVAAPAGAPPPPNFVLWLLSRLHPTLRARNRRVKEVIRRRAWREDADLFADEVRPELMARHQALLAEDVRTMDEAALLAHIERCHAALERAVFLHGRFTAASQFPMGDLIVHVKRWTGASAPETLRLVAGHAPTSAGRSPVFDALVEELRAQGIGLDGADADPASVLDGLLGAPGALGRLAREWVGQVGYRTLVAYDIAEPTAIEFPFLLVAALRAALSGRRPVDQRLAEEEAALRARVPQADREAFDGLLAEARKMSALRDERTLYADYWATGILRRAVLEAGRRLAQAGRIPTAEHLCFAELEEIRSLLRGQGGPDGRVLEDRAAARRPPTTPPPALFGELHAPPSPDLFPAPTARAMRAVFAVLDAMFQDHGGSDQPEANAPVSGFPVSAGVYVGPVRLVKGPEDFHRIRPGDVLVTTMTSPTYNVILPMLGALITDRGGALSHAAIVSREFGIPGVVGCRNATARLQDGQRVRVDGGAGTVTPVTL
jgi:phosphohistidine swiveling domain-containing protein